MIRAAGVDLVTLGQYLRPSSKHAPVDRYVEPATFDRFADEAQKMGFAFVASGPFIRSSYNAIDFSKKVMAERVAKLDAQSA